MTGKKRGRKDEMPSPPLTPSPRRSHHIAAPATPAAPVPVDHAPIAVRDALRVGRVVVSWRKVSSPSPDEKEASEMPARRGLTPDDSAMI